MVTGPPAATHEIWMARALALAELGRGGTSPNPMVGALVVTPEGIVVGSGYHERAGEAHAEVYALSEAGERANGATLYCTLEPCAHIGRTGPCAVRVAEAGIARVVAAIEDPYPEVSGRGFAYLRARGVEVEVGVMRQSAARLNDAFFTFVRQGRPFVTMKIATSLDGRIAAGERARTTLTGEVSRRRAHRLRAEVDAIAVGSTTILVDDPLLTARGVHRTRPLIRVIFDARLRTPPTARILSTIDQGPVLILTAPDAVERRTEQVDALRRAGATIEPTPPHDVAAALRRLAELRVTSLLIEGGTTLHRSVWRSGLVDRLHIHIAPRCLGPEGIPWLTSNELSLAALHDVTVEQHGDDAFVEAYVHRTD